MRRLVVGIDYGVSNSGVAYTIIDDEDADAANDSGDDIVVIKDWPHAGASRDASEKVPSDIAYDEHGRPSGYGFEITKGSKPLQWVKLLLEPDSFKEQSDKTSRVWESYYKLGSQLLRRSPVETVGDYLTWLWTTCKTAILEKEGEDHDDTDLFHPAKLTVILTVPPSWSSRAKQSMARAAVAAGIPEVSLKTLAEPEAAAVFGLKRQAKKKSIADGDCVIICDAGGGTVDVVAYQVRSREPLSLDQITVSKGDFCGSTFVNTEFKSQLQSILGIRYDTLSRQTKDRIDEEFEYDIKRTYNPLNDQKKSTYYITVDGMEDNQEMGIKDGKMKIDEAVVSTSFDSVMTQIMTLIDDQIDELKERGLSANLKGLLLVGGFGKSGFLRNRIRQEYPGRNDLKIWPVDDSWTAVVKGAVACEASAIGRQALIHSRLSGSNYGIPFMHQGRRKVQWLVRKGQSVKSDLCTEPYALRIDDQPWLKYDDYCLVYVPIVASNESNANDEHTDAVAPHAEIKCRVPTDLRFKPGSREIQTHPTKAWHIPATLVLYFDGALISFRCRIEDHEVGVAEVKYFNDEVDCRTTKPDQRSESVPAIPMDRETTGRVSRADSKISLESDGSNAQNKPAHHRHVSAPQSIALSNETATASSSMANSVHSNDSLTIRTKRDKPKKRRFFGGAPTYHSMFDGGPI